ncbi:MAG: type IV pilus modification protein PilV [Methylococcales bacterium]|nr:type IV pilus modification protein PilV [Methylococcales bacterium]
MIAVLVISIGLLGLASLQGTSIRNNHDSYLRSQATLLGHGMLDRMRANRVQAITGQYDLALATTPSSPKNCEDSASAAAICNAVEMTLFDQASWANRVALGLPNGDASISSQILAGDRALITVTLQWGADSTSQFALSSEI